MSNCAGIRKKALSPARMASVKRAVFSFYPVKPEESEDVAWREYRKAIDTSCRKTRIL